MARSSKLEARSLGAILSAILLMFAFPNFNLRYLAWFGLVPLFFAIEKVKSLKAFLLSYITGAVFFLGAIYWLVHVTLPGMIIVALYLALYVGFFGALSSIYIRRILDRGSHTPLLFFVPAVWVVFEWLRSNLLGGFGWALLGYSQSRNLPVIQIADILGAYGVSYIIVMVNTAVFLTIKMAMSKKKPGTVILAAALLIFISLYYGYYRLNNIFTGEKLVVGVAQGNIPQDQKWDLDFREEIFRKYEGLTNELARQRPDLIIWPETSVPAYIGTDPVSLERVKSLAANIRTTLLVGAPREERLKDKASYYNSAILFDEDGSVLERYDKTHLVPFGEYVPLKGILSFVENFASSPIGDFTRGEKYTVFKFTVKRRTQSKDVTWRLIKKVRFSALICFEDIFPQLSRRFVKEGATFLVNITNDAWFGRTSAPYQHAEASVFRAVENRVNVIRSANTGLSCFIDQKGSVTESVSEGGKDIFVSGFKSAEITLTETRTFYNIYGDLFVYLCIFLLIISLVRAPKLSTAYIF